MRSTRLLAVDDNERNLAILRKTLAPEFEVVCENSGERGIETALRIRPDLVLLDVMMPGIDGHETCRRLRLLPELAGTKIIMVSAKALTSERLAGYEAGADDYVVKPFNQDELLAKVRVYTRLKAVEELDRLKSDLLGLLSHETRTPLTSILSPAQMLLDDPALGPEQVELIRTIERGGRRLLSLIEKVLFLSQLKAETVRYDVQDLDLRSLCETVIRRFDRTAREAGVTVALEADSPAIVPGDAQHLQTVLEILLDNAVRLTPRDGRVSVKIARDDWRITLLVVDQGPGIAAETLPRLFDEFVVGDLRFHQKGHGLSLAIARLIVDQHHGDVFAASGDGVGATIGLHLPATAAAKKAA